MPKSNYPQKLDTSVEIPPVRDNILEAGSDVINSLRSAIFNIERTLGINPQGAVGNTLSDRLSRVLDGNGNIKSEALDRANVLSGPIIDSNVSSVAAIKESKLKLDYPTTLLQDEISILNSNLDTLIDQISELSIELAIHTNTSATNRHPATAISVSAHTAVPSDVASVNLSTGSVQDTFEIMYNEHLNYTGENISESNRSHTADQIFFNNEDVSEIVTLDNAQGAIEEIALASLSAQILHQDLFHVNTILKTAKIDSAENVEVGNILAENIAITFSKTIGSDLGTTVITLDDSVELGDFDLRRSDILTITDENDEDELYSGSYEIESYTLNSDEIATITIYGLLISDSTSLSVGRISKNIKANSNPVSLLISVREEPDLTAARYAQIANPNAVKVITSGIKPSEITTSNRFIDITINSEAAITLDLYHSDVDRQNIDSVISRINEQCAENAYDFLSYRVDQIGLSSEAAIVHSLPDSSDEVFTLKVTRSTDDGIVSAGFSHIEDVIISSDYGSVYFIEGKAYEGLKVKLDSTTLSFSANAITVNSSASGLDFLDLGIKRKDLLIITDASDDDDNGTYVIEQVNATQLVLNSSQVPGGFTNFSGSEARFRIYENTVGLDSITFDEVSATFSAALIDVFMDKNRNIFFDKKFEYTSELLGSDSLAILVDYTGDIGDKSFSLNITSGTNEVTLTLDDGPSVTIKGKNNYIWLESGLENVRLKLLIPSVDSLNTKISSIGTDLALTFYGFYGANSDSNLFIGRIPFDNFNGRISGGEDTARIRSIVEHGSIGVNDLGDSAIFELRTNPLDELRANGVVFGLEIIDAAVSGNLFEFGLSNGTCYVRGKRIELKKIDLIITDINAVTNDKIFIVVDYDGNIQFKPATTDCFSPFLDSEVCTLGSLEYDGTTTYNYDLRLFISEIDLKLLNAVTVSPVKNMGHFSNVSSAIKYAKRFSQIYTDAGYPSIHLKSGTHEIRINVDLSTYTFSDWSDDLVDDPAAALSDYYDAQSFDGAVLDFPISIIGEGNSSVLKIRTIAEFADATYNFRGIMLIPGNGFTTHTVVMDKLTSGFINLENFKLDNTRIVMVDLNIQDSDENNLSFGVNLQNLIFDFDNFTANPYDTLIGSAAISIIEQDDITETKGNVYVNNCKLIECQVDLDGPTRLRNLCFTNNWIYNDSDLPLFNADIYTFLSATSGANITIFGNHNVSNFSEVGDAEEPEIITGESWGDRINRNLLVGGELTTSGAATFGGGGTFDGYGTFTGIVTADNYIYTTALEREKTIFFESLSDTAMGSTSGNKVAFSTQEINSRVWRTMEFTDTEAGTEFALIRLEVLPGETLKEIKVFYSTIDSGNSVSGGYNITIYSENYYGDIDVEMVATDLPSNLRFSNGEMSWDGKLSGIDIEGENGKYVYIDLKRADQTGFNEDVHYIWYKTEVNSADAIGGLT